jgi:adenylate cyclase
MPDKELHYVILAAKDAHRHGAIRDAIRYYQRAIELLRQQPETAERSVRELDLQLDLGANLVAGEGYGSATTFETFERARQLCQQIGTTPQYFKVVSGLNVFYIVRAKLKTAYELAEQALQMAERAQDSALYLETYRMMAAATFWSGQFVPAHKYMNDCYAVYDPVKHRPNIMLYGQDSAVCVLANGGWLNWFRGYSDLALETCTKGVQLAESIGHAFSLCFGLSFLNNLFLCLDEAEMLRASAERLEKITAEHKIRSYAIAAKMHQGWYNVLIGNHAAGLALFQQVLTSYRLAGSLTYIPFVLNLAADTHLRMGNIEDGLNAVHEAFEVLKTNETRAFMPELYRLQGELMLQHKSHTQDEAIGSIRNALELARKMTAKSLELRAAMSLYRAQGEPARAHLENVYNWFTEGLNTAPLRTARALLGRT